MHLLTHLQCYARTVYAHGPSRPAASKILRSGEYLVTEAGPRRSAVRSRRVTRGRPVTGCSRDGILILKCDCSLPV